MEQIDLSRSQQIQVRNNVYVLGNPVVAVPTLEQLVQALDNAGEGQPIVIISPEATTIPDLSDRLSQLIQNNRRIQPENNTTDDRYRFMNMSDAELSSFIDTLPNVTDKAATLYIYQGLRARAQTQYYLDLYVRERDILWSRHCVNPTSNEGVERYMELSNVLIPQMQAEFSRICEELKRLDEEQAKSRAEVQQPVSSSVNTVNNTTTQIEIKQSVEPEPIEINVSTESTGSNKDLCTQWKNSAYIKMPLSISTNIANSNAYAVYKQQQTDVEYNGKHYKAVPLEILIHLGIKLYQDGVPVVYTETGRFKRIGNSDVSPLNIKYWYPKPEI